MGDKNMILNIQKEMTIRELRIQRKWKGVYKTSTLNRTTKRRN